MTKNDDIDAERFLEALRRRLPRATEARVRMSPRLCEVLAEYLEAVYQPWTETLLPLAAAEPLTGGRRFESASGEWSLTFEEVLGDESRNILKFKCTPKSASSMVGRRVVVRISDEVHDLGQVDRHGIAEAEVPANLDLSSEIEVVFSEGK